jgi:hypothetical protein
MPNGDWEEHSALFGFTQLNSSHDGVRLGRALFKIVKRLAIGDKVCFRSLFCPCSISMATGWVGYLRQRLEQPNHAATFRLDPQPIGDAKEL